MKKRVYLNRETGAIGVYKYFQASFVDMDKLEVWYYVGEFE